MKSLSSKIYGAALTVGFALLALAGPVLFALLFPVNALADTVVPPTYSTTLPLGQSATIAKTVTISSGTPTSAKVDVFFFADTTGSMGAALQSVKDGAAAIMAATSGLGDVAYAVGEYKDFGQDDPFTYRLNQDITKETAAVQTGINAWVASGGGDLPEGQLYGLDQVATTTSWRPGSTRIIIWFGDAPGHDPAGPDPGVTEVQATAALIANTIKVLALDLGILNDSGQALRIANATGGQYYNSVVVAQIVNVIQSAIITSFATYSTVSLGTASVPTGLTVNIVPPSFTGTFDRSIDRTFSFDVTFTAVSPGSYSFPIPVLVDGGTMATEQDNIQVNALAAGLAFPLPRYTPSNAPVSAIMDNSVLERIPIQFYVAGNTITAFNGETGNAQNGVKFMYPSGQFWPAYKNSGGTDFFPPDATGRRPLNYINGPWLSYAGNPGYNYQVPEGTQVLASGDGKLYKVLTDAGDPVNGGNYDFYHNSYIDHQNGWYSWYLYAPLDPAILAQISLNGYAQVTKGQIIGQTTGDHLHFEVRHNGFDHANVVDPYKLGLWLPSRPVNSGPQTLLLLE
jgi:murein DD-endopeptidase MepM/ murein hydrolase activator NlpD